MTTLVVGATGATGRLLVKQLLGRGEAVKAIIVLKPGASAGEDDIAGPVAAAKGSYQAPKSVDFVDSIPQTPVGKPDKKALRARYAETATA